MRVFNFKILLIQCILGCSQESNGTDVLSACEFWLSLSQQIRVKEVLDLPQLGRLVPFLIKWMRFSDSEHDLGWNVHDEDEKDAGSDGALYYSELSKSLLSLDHIILVKLFVSFREKQCRYFGSAIERFPRRIAPGPLGFTER